MKSDKLILLAYLLFCCQVLWGQQAQENYVFPINPGQVNFLAANMGELRTNHFHAGADIKTGGKVGYPAYAAEGGYVARIKVSTFGYGNVVYIRHPGNKVTVYAHLEKFNGPIGDYVRKKQYEQQSFDIELFPAPSELPVVKGEIIGLAGNSGSSQGPHLHYELRDTTDRVFNPMILGFKEIKDNIPPVFQKIAVMPMDINARVNGEFSRKEFQAVKSGSAYVIPSAIKAGGLLGLELKALDKKNGTHNSYGVNFIQVSVDGNVTFTYNLSTFTFDKSRYINEHINYPVFINTGARFERLYVADGNKLDAYSCPSPLRGRIVITDAQVHKVRILIRDDFNNESVLNFSIKGEELKTPQVPSSSAPVASIYSEIVENTLKITAKSPGDPEAYLYFKNNKVKLPPAYLKTGAVVYLYDLRKGLPDSLSCGSAREVFDFVKIVPSGVEQQVNYQNISIRLPAGAIADTVFFRIRKEMSNGKMAYWIHDRTVSLYDSILLTIEPEEKTEDKLHTFLYSGEGAHPSFEGGAWKGNKIEVKTRNLGKFTLAEDTVKPQIRFISNYGNSAKFYISDAFAGIGSFRATLNGYWLLMNYDHKRKLLWSERLEKTVPLKGELKLEVKDNAGNTSLYIINL